MKVLNFNDPYVDIKGDVNNLGDLFTDTIYDDTEVKESIAKLNSDLGTLEYSDVAGGKNLANVDNISDTFVFKVSENRTYFLSANGANTYRVLGFKNGKHTTNIALNTNLIGGSIINTSNSDIDEIHIDFVNKVTGFLDDKLFLRYYEYEDAQYEPYIPSVNILTVDVAEIKNDLDVKSGDIVYNSCELDDSSFCWCKKSGRIVQCSLSLKNINTTSNWQSVVVLPFRPCSKFYISDRGNSTEWYMDTNGVLSRFALSTNLSMLVSFTYLTND